MNDDPEPDELPTTVDVLRYGQGDNPTYMTVPGDDGTKVVGAHARQAAGSRRRRLVASVAAAGAVAAVGYYLAEMVVGAVGLLILFAAAGYEHLRADGVPEVVGRNVHAEEALERYDVEGYVEDVFVE
jgi:hypothetical protein